MAVINLLNPAYPQFTDLVDELTRERMPAGDDLHRGRNVIVKASRHDVDIVVKEFRRITCLNRWVYAHIRKSKARRSYEHALRLLKLGIDTPQPIAMVDIVRYNLLRKSYYVSLNSNGTRFTHWREGDDQEHHAQTLAAFMLTLHRKGVCHKDFNEGNILLMPDGNFELIDLNRMRFYDGEVPQKAVLTNFCQLNDSAGNRPEALQRLARCYASLRGDDNPDEFARMALNATQRFTKHHQLKYRIKHPQRYKRMINNG